jgi:uncharacterized protein
MARKLFVNLPVNDLNQSVRFFTRLGFSFNPQFTDDTATCMIVSDDIFVMLLTRTKFQSFAPNPACDARASTEVLLALSCDSRAQVDEMVSTAINAGGNTYNTPQDHGFMYQHGFQDLDGHVWEIFWMDPATIPTQQ